jgi:hypothetical protein
MENGMRKIIFFLPRPLGASPLLGEALEAPWKTSCHPCLLLLFLRNIGGFDAQVETSLRINIYQLHAHFVTQFYHITDFFHPFIGQLANMHDNIHEFWPDNMLDLILEKQNARIENDYSDFNIYNIQNSFVYKENRAKKINVFAFEVIAQNQSALIEAALKLNWGDFIGYALDSKYIKIPRDLEYVLRNFEIYDDDGDIIGYTSKADDYLYQNYAVEL